MKKRMISLVLALAMCLSLCTTVFADPGASVEEKKSYLLNTCNIPADFWTRQQVTLFQISMRMPQKIT